MTPTPSPDLDLAEVGDALRRGFRGIVIGGLVGVVAAVLVILFAPARFDGRALLLVRTQQLSAGTLMREQFGALAPLAGDALGLGSGGDAIKTELALLQSRSLLGDVVDSLRLQVRAGRRPPVLLEVDVPRDERFKPRKISLADGSRAKLVDREDAIDDLEDRLGVKVSGGDAIEISYRSRDSLSAAAVPNLVAARYLARRKTVDRGLNQRRVEFLEAQVDSVAQALREAVDAARRVGQGGAGLAAESAERAELEQRVAMQLQLVQARGELQALDALLSDLSSGESQRLAGFPSLLKSPAVNELVAELARRETERTVLLARVTERDPEAIALDSAITRLRAQLRPLADTYASALRAQVAELSTQVEASEARSRALPAAAASLYLAQGEVERLAKLNLALAAQLLEARLAALAEGGDVRLVDAAVAPRRVSFPRKATTLATGLVAGLVLGLFVALLPLLGTRPTAD